MTIDRNKQPEREWTLPSETARGALKGHWNQAAGISVLLIAASMLCSVITGLFERNSTPAADWMSFFTGIILQLFLAVLADGALLVFRDLLRKKTVNVRSLVIPFTTQPDRFLIVELIMTAAGILFLSPVIFSAYLPGLNTAGFGVILALTAAGAIASLLVRIAFAPAVWFLLEDEELGALPALRMAADTMKGRRLSLVKVLLPFIGYFILCFLTLGIGLLWVIPYLIATLAAFFESVSPESAEES